MKIGNRTYEVKESDCWAVFPSLTLVVNIWTKSEATYLLTGPITFNNPQNLIGTQFQSEFSIQEINDMDSTLMENGKAIEIFNQKVVFDTPSLFNLKAVNITGETINNEPVEVHTKTVFLGFEILKMKDYRVQSQVNAIESKLKNLSVPFHTIDEIENELIRIEIER